MEPESDASTEADATPALAGPQAGTILGPRYTEALMQAKFLHASHRRRGTLIPYMAHLQSVSALVLEDGGSEDEAIAALLHDAVEEYEPGVLEMIVEQFGMEVGRIVAGCADPDPEPGVGWRELKIRHMRELESAGPQVRRVALAEKLDNARAVLRDYRRVGEGLWASMDVNPDDLLWYYDALADLFVTERPGDMASELQDTVERLLDAAAEPETVS
jgi:(p)ppGpp synthase/HD superfamily hydrolase